MASLTYWVAYLCLALLCLTVRVSALLMDLETQAFLKNLNNALGCNWNQDDPCTFKGVTCTDYGDGYVGVEIYLHAAGLNGYLPTAYSSYTRITKINLKNNRGIKGSFPESWSRLNRLTDLDLSYTSLTGQIPDSWERMSKLQNLAITHTDACYRLPSWNYYNMDSIKSIDLSENHIYSLNTNGFGGLRSSYTLRSLSISGNPLCGCDNGFWSSNYVMEKALQRALPSALESTCVANCTEGNKCLTGSHATTVSITVGAVVAALVALAALVA